MEAHCFYRGEDRASACEPKAAGRCACASRTPSRVPLKHAEKKALTGGSRASATEGGRERGVGGLGRGRRTGPAVGLLGRGKEEENESWAGLG